MDDVEEELLLDQLYEAAAIPDRWTDFLGTFMRAAGAEHAVMVAQREGFNRYIGSSPECVALVRSHFDLFPTNERTRRLVELGHPGFVTDRDVFTDEEMACEPVYRDFWYPKGYGSGVATVVCVPTGDSLILHAERFRTNGPVSPHTIERLDRLRPHFARAALLSSRLEMARVQATARALQLIGLPAAVLAQTGRILAANELLVGLIPAVVQDRKTRVVLTDQNADALLGLAVSKLNDAPHQDAVRSIPIKARDGHSPFIMHLVPIRGTAQDIFAGGSAVLVATAVSPRNVAAANIVQGLFDLTPAEAKVAALVASCHPPRKCAALLGISEETARTTLKSVLAKTGTCRQAELVALLQGTTW